MSPEKVSLKLVRGGNEQSVGVLLTRRAAWLDYVDTAPQVRLKQWTFAVDVRDDSLDVIVRGTPSPPISGIGFVEEQGIAIPAGYTLDPPIEAAVVAEMLMLSLGDLALLHVDGTYEHIAADCFVQARRSAVRLSLAAASIDSGA